MHNCSIEQLNKSKSVVYKFIKQAVVPVIVPIDVCSCSVKVAIEANEISKMQALIALNSTVPEINVCEKHAIKDGVLENAIRYNKPKNLFNYHCVN